MAQFPVLKTGAVAQYPSKYTVTYRADIVAFLDGSEQRFRNSPSMLYAWEIRLDQLDEQEMANMEHFFLANQGGAISFSFTDPWSGIIYPSCSLGSDDISEMFIGQLWASTQLVIRENRT